MKKIVCFLLLTALMCSCVSAGLATLNYSYDPATGMLTITSDTNGLTQVTVNGAGGHFVDSNNSYTVKVTPDANGNIVIRANPDPALGGDSGSWTISAATNPPATYPPVTVPPVTNPPVVTAPPATYPPVTVPPSAGDVSISVSGYNNGVLSYSVSGIDIAGEIWVDGSSTGRAVFDNGGKQLMLGDLTPGTHTITLVVGGEYRTATFTVPEKTPAHTTHTWSEWQETQKATCTQRGIRTRKCTGCTATETEYSEPLGHDPVILEGKAPTCTETGLSEGKKCSRCGTVLEDRVYLPPRGHRYDKIAEDESFITYKCAVCGVTMKQQKERKPNPTIAPASAATLAPSSTTAPVSVAPVMVLKNQYGSILFDSSMVSVDYNSYAEPADPTTLVIEADLTNRTGRPTEIGMYLDRDLVTQWSQNGYTAVKYVNGNAVLFVSLANYNDAWFATDEQIMYRVFSTDPAAVGGVLVKVEAQLMSTAKIEANTITGVVLKGVSDIVVSQNGVYDITR
jgi:hypothetical protein